MRPYILRIGKKSLFVTIFPHTSPANLVAWIA
jgi:hypothetical protein